MTASEQIEQEANYFAMHLLVPTALLREDMRKIGGIDLSGDDAALKKLAKKYGVSIAVMAYRIGEESATGA